MWDTTNQLLTCHLSFRPLWQVDEWMATPFIISMRGCLLNFLIIKAKRCLFNKQNNTWIPLGMEFLFLCSTWCLFYSHQSLVRYQNEHEKKNSITRVLMYYSISNCHFELSLLSSSDPLPKNLWIFGHKLLGTWLKQYIHYILWVQEDLGGLALHGHPIEEKIIRETPWELIDILCRIFNNCSMRVCGIKDDK